MSLSTKWSQMHSITPIWIGCIFNIIVINRISHIKVSDFKNVLEPCNNSFTSFGSLLSLFRTFDRTHMCPCTILKRNNWWCIVWIHYVTKKYIYDIGKYNSGSITDTSWNTNTLFWFDIKKPLNLRFFT